MKAVYFFCFLPFYEFEFSFTWSDSNAIEGFFVLPCSWLQREVDPRDLASFLSLERDPRTTRFII
jgi:hypothetical protein